MKSEKYDYDVAVIGAGPAGIMAAIQAAQRGLRVALIEKNNSIAKKLLLSGGGRCNLSNAEFDLKKLVRNYNNGEFLFRAFSVFGPKETIKFFEELGVKTKIEKNNKVFPVSDDADDVLEALKKCSAKNKVKILYNSEVIGVDFKNKKINKLVLKDKNITAKNFVLATGGMSYPATGSTGLGYKLAEKLGHTIVKPMPALSPVALKEDWVKNLQGISLKGVKINIFQEGRKPASRQGGQFSEEGEILFTHFGVSGPAVLNISGKVRELLETGKVKISLDLSPLLNQDQLLKNFEKVLKKFPNKTIKNILSDFVQERLADVLLDILENKNPPSQNASAWRSKIANNMPKIERIAIVKIIKNLKADVGDVLGFNLAKVTRGGISLKEIDHKTMKSKIIDNLFFAGEIIDVDGKTGGFNLQMCWSTGYLAGLVFYAK